MTPNNPFNNDDEDTGFGGGESFDQINRRLVGERGDTILHEELTHTDLDTLTEITETTDVAICNCGGPYTATTEIHRCVQCDHLACTQCVLWLHRRHYCPPCTEQAYALDKKVYLSLLFLKEDILQPDQLLQVDTVADEPVEVRVDRVATVLTEHNYIDTDSGDLTMSGAEALSVGQQLYGDDKDIQAVHRKLRKDEVANNGGHPEETILDRLTP